MDNGVNLQKKDMVAYSNAKIEYNLTDKMMKIIGDPDKLRVNPYNPSGGRIKYFLIIRIEEFIKNNSEWVDKIKTRRELRKKKKKAEFETRITMERDDALCEIINFESKIDIGDITNDIINSCAVFNQWNNPSFMEEVTKEMLLNHIRHEFSNYEYYLDMMNQFINTNEIIPIKLEDLLVKLQGMRNFKITKKYRNSTDPFLGEDLYLCIKTRYNILIEKLFNGNFPKRLKLYNNVLKHKRRRQSVKELIKRNEKKIKWKTKQLDKLQANGSTSNNTALIEKINHEISELQNKMQKSKVKLQILEEESQTLPKTKIKIW